MKRENPMWGAPRIHGEVPLLGFEISEPTVSRYLQLLRRAPEESKANQWLACPYRYVLFDHDAKFGNDVLEFLRSSDLTPLLTTIGSPWQNGTAEPWVGSARRE